MTRGTSLFSLGYSVLAGPIVWAIHFVVVYAIGEFGCRANFNNWQFISPANIQMVIAAATIVGLIAVGGSGLLAYRYWREQPDDSTLIRFLGMTGILLSLLFLLAILATFTPIFVLPVCDWVA
jgi:hypothetical protein